MIQTPESKYFLLEEGDIMEAGDEFYNPRDDKWEPVTDGEPECPHCNSSDVHGFNNLDNGQWMFECKDCQAEFTQPNYPDAFIGYGWDPQESKPIRRKNPDYKPVQSKPKLRINSLKKYQK